MALIKIVTPGKTPRERLATWINAHNVRTALVAMALASGEISMRIGDREFKAVML